MPPANASFRALLLLGRAGTYPGVLRGHICGPGGPAKAVSGGQGAWDCSLRAELWRQGAGQRMPYYAGPGSEMELEVPEVGCGPCTAKGGPCCATHPGLRTAP